ncbi:hypothetical protein Poli38472_008304 [Pythium oligandrum]|uniref:HSF-type DNA-binding domain-containing protein n=1 Tax=Pythium oligandrum TaxID=41045 RepID=A0A8K1CLF8_PYTOL|nr:hypothetical protein Poli38472_008304 [Pythium oligandrum]|eukprot:TMW65662.1 hypothetical protein Poli38472_008304 [Pythium oligandrum]
MPKDEDFLKHLYIVLKSNDVLPCLEWDALNDFKFVWHGGSDGEMTEYLQERRGRFGMTKIDGFRARLAKLGFVGVDTTDCHGGKKCTVYSNVDPKSFRRGMYASNAPLHEAEAPPAELRPATVEADDIVVMNDNQEEESERSVETLSASRITAKSTVSSPDTSESEDNQAETSNPSLEENQEPRYATQRQDHTEVAPVIEEQAADRLGTIGVAHYDDEVATLLDLLPPVNGMTGISDTMISDLADVLLDTSEGNTMNEPQPEHAETTQEEVATTPLVLADFPVGFSASFFDPVPQNQPMPLATRLTSEEEDGRARYVRRRSEEEEGLDLARLRPAPGEEEAMFSIPVGAYPHMLSGSDLPDNNTVPDGPVPTQTRRREMVTTVQIVEESDDEDEECEIGKLVGPIVLR